MNRILKFRVWDVEQRKFLPSYADQGVEFFHEQGESWHERQIRSIVPVSWFMSDHNANLDNYVVQQYTGCEDRNGKEIFEGDLVEIEEQFKDRSSAAPYTNHRTRTEVVEFRGGCYWLGPFNFTQPICDKKNLTAVGNIFQPLCNHITSYFTVEGRCCNCGELVFPGQRTL